MGYKSYMITINNQSQPIDDRILLDKLGFSQFQFIKETTLEQCMYPRDKSINLGMFNNSLIICDDFQLASQLALYTKSEKLAPYEQVLTDLFPSSEILTTNCHSTGNLHMYTLVSNGKRVRFKLVAPGELVEFGERITEEEKVYAFSEMVNGKRVFKSRYDEEDNYRYNEDQMMEEFTFGVAARHLGLNIAQEDDEALMFTTKFRKYLKS
ncbi:hypothetical protein QNI19_36930 [Cytophagaceae bacterium DM2B3-1]|uniref:Uncharacterized protein n=1 Tax=Xanthocytophaga flava TaxID=3048013 RepID=A0ABT7CXW9_9BACT|nr:hypothetical protein [Xanthocytophaga flavus]MDJ1498578.1 hypothetical protein [Xanthocytophaga flavus]